MHFDHIYPLLQTFPRYPLPNFMLSVSVPPSLPSSVPLFHTFSVSLQPIKSSLHWLTIPGRETCPGVSNNVNCFCPTNANKMNMSYKNSNAFFWKEGGGGNTEPVFPCGGSCSSLHCDRVVLEPTIHWPTDTLPASPASADPTASWICFLCKKLSMAKCFEPDLKLNVYREIM